MKVVVVVRPVGDEQDLLLAEALQGEVMAGGLAGVDDVELRPLVRSFQVVQGDVCLHQHLGHVVQRHEHLEGNSSNTVSLVLTEVSFSGKHVE